MDGISGAGAVNVIYGSPGGGLAFTNNQVWTQNSSGIVDQAEAADLFGASLATGDFNGDGFADLAIGVKGETTGSADSGPATGAVQVLLGSASGITSASNKIWTQDTPGIPGTAASFEYFGDALAAGDFNDDGVADLAIGAPQESEYAATNSGAVYVLYGSAPGGLNAGSAGPQVWNQNMPGSPDPPEQDDQFGYSLTTGDFNGDGRR